MDDITPIIIVSIFLSAVLSIPFILRWGLDSLRDRVSVCKEYEIYAMLIKPKSNALAITSDIVHEISSIREHAAKKELLRYKLSAVLSVDRNSLEIGFVQITEELKGCKIHIIQRVPSLDVDIADLYHDKYRSLGRMLKEIYHISLEWGLFCALEGVNGIEPMHHPAHHHHDDGHAHRDVIESEVERTGHREHRDSAHHHHHHSSHHGTHHGPHHRKGSSRTTAMTQMTQRKRSGVRSRNRTLSRSRKRTSSNAEAPSRAPSRASRSRRVSRNSMRNFSPIPESQALKRMIVDVLPENIENHESEDTEEDDYDDDVVDGQMTTDRYDIIKYDEISVNHSESDDGESESSDYDEHQNQSKQTKASTATAN